jgi:hypothetical protein
VNLREKAQAAVATARAEAESLRQQVSDLEAARTDPDGGRASGGGRAGGGGGGGEEDADAERIQELERQLQEAEELSQELSDAVEQRDNIIAKVRTAFTSAPCPHVLSEAEALAERILPPSPLPCPHPGVAAMRFIPPLEQLQCGKHLSAMPIIISISPQEKVDRDCP